MYDKPIRMAYTPISTERALERLEGLASGLYASDPEMMHVSADNILLALVPEEVREAYDRVVKAADWWAFA